MNITRESIDRFFSKECTDEEAAQVSDYLKNNPAVLEEYLSRQEWDDIKANTAMPAEFWDEAWKRIQQKRNKGGLVLWMKRMAVAAAVIGVSGLLIYQFAGNDHKNKATAPVAAVSKHKIISNTTPQKMQIVLPDSSVVELSPQSDLAYDEPFQNNKRDIHLSGEALFSVAKDKTRPFTVYANGIATTALGTQFKVSAFAGSKVTVKLFEGKVSIHTIGQSIAMKEVFLTPGQEFSIDQASGRFALREFGAGGKGVNKKAEGHKGANDMALSFNKTSLPTVLDKISKYHNIHLIYNREEIKSLQFTGTFLKTDSLNMVLSVICHMNDLSYHQEGEHITITRKK